MKKFLIAACIILLSTGAFSQSKKLWLMYADEAYKKKDYATAINYYSKVLDDTTILDIFVLPYEVTLVNLPMKDLKDTTKVKKGNVVKVGKYDYILHQLGHSYQLNADYHHAAVYLKKSMDRGVYTDDEYYYALSLMQLKRYTEAMNEFETYSGSSYKTDSLTRQAQHQMSSCFYAQDSINNTHKHVRVRMMDTAIINKGSANFAPMFYGSPTRLIFTSARKGGVVNNPEKQDSKYLCDLWQTELRDSVWSKPINFGRPVNSGLHEGAGIVSVDEIMFLTRWSDNNRDETFIYMAKMQDGRFFECYKLDKNVNISGYKSMHPYITFDGTKLFFSSNRPGGKGGMDIWYVNIDENGATSEPHNLGPTVNTAGDEVSPFFHHVSSTLFFASNGHAGLGGLDLFKSSYSPDDTTFTLAKNLGQPINSSKDDAYLIMERTQSKGYFASDREDCPDGHCYDIYEFDNEPIEFDLSGVVFDATTNLPIPSALVTIKDVHGDMEPLLLITDEKGYYFTTLLSEKEFYLKAQKKQYFADAASLATKGKTETTHFVQDFFLNMIPGGDVVIEGVEYDLDKATLRPKSKEILDNIYNMLKLNENISIEINSHTDTRGSDIYNMKLSQARAQSCVDYLISKGINKDRLIPKGYGETKPIFSDAEIAKLATKEEKEAEHQKNRRTAFRVIGEADLKGKSSPKS
ncbi:MAG TPA: OmpA family protein [Bacteroidia bacterium]|jgi:OOP family OmpA-OmpF porin|nr:OmpA family protein [Bacteroidia bacterium]